MVVKTLTQEQATGVLRIVESLVTVGGSVDKIYFGPRTSFNLYAFGGGFGVSYNGYSVEHFNTLQEFADFYNLAWM